MYSTEELREYISDPALFAEALATHVAISNVLPELAREIGSNPELEAAVLKRLDVHATLELRLWQKRTIHVVPSPTEEAFLTIATKLAQERWPGFPTAKIAKRTWCEMCGQHWSGRHGAPRVARSGARAHAHREHTTKKQIRWELRMSHWHEGPADYSAFDWTAIAIGPVGTVTIKRTRDHGHKGRVWSEHDAAVEQP